MTNLGGDHVGFRLRKWKAHMAAWLAALLVLTGVTVFPASSKADSGLLFEQGTLFTAREDNIRGFRIPGIVVTKAGSVLAFTEGRISSMNDHAASHIVMKRSVDNGQSWGPIEIVVESTESKSWSNPVPVVEQESGIIYLFYTLNIGNNSSQVFYISSQNDGVTWSAPMEITSLFDEDPLERSFHLTGPGHGIQLSSGRLLVVVWHRHATTKSEEERDYGASTIYSDDGGQTWEMGGYLEVDSETDTATDESRILELEDGTVVMNSRSSLETRRMIATSDDGGETWTKPVADTTIDEYTRVDSGFIRHEGANALLLSHPDSS